MHLICLHSSKRVFLSKTYTFVSVFTFSFSTVRAARDSGGWSGLTPAVVRSMLLLLRKVSSGSSRIWMMSFMCKGRKWSLLEESLRLCNEFARDLKYVLTSWVAYENLFIKFDDKTKVKFYLFLTIKLESWSGNSPSVLFIRKCIELLDIKNFKEISNFTQNKTSNFPYFLVQISLSGYCKLI